jgi:hypothetical protein
MSPIYPIGEIFFRIRSRERMKTIEIAAVFLTICIALSTASEGGLPTLPSGKENPLPILYPELNKKAAPTWVTEGLRATYYATVDAGAKEDGRAEAGEALLQTEVVAMEGSSAATSTSMYVRGPLGYLRPLISASFGSIVPVGCGDFWCSPEVLAKVAERDDDEVTIIRGPVEVAGSSYRAIRFEVSHEGLRYSMTYDEDSGLLLHHRYDILSADGTSVETGIIDFRSIRQVEIPWTGGSAPAWLRAGQKMIYQGQMVYEIPGTVPSPFPVTLQAEVVSVQARSSVVRWTSVVGGSPSIPAYTASGARQLMGFWLPEAALEIDEVGDVDEDPETGMMISVIQNDQNGIFFEETNGRDYQRLLTYDKATGKLIESYEEQLTEAMTGTVQKTQVQLAI